MRLEPGQFVGSSRIVLFQFHKGAIRTVASLIVKLDGKNFNSIKVRLEHKQEALEFAKREFQFHKGAIRTYYCNR